MPGSSQPWDQQEDPRDQTVDLPRIDLGAGNGSASGEWHAPDLLETRNGRVKGNGHATVRPILAEPYGRFEPPARAEFTGQLDPLPRREPRLNGDPYTQPGSGGHPPALFTPVAPPGPPAALSQPPFPLTAIPQQPTTPPPIEAYDADALPSADGQARPPESTSDPEPSRRGTPAEPAAEGVAATHAAPATAATGTAPATGPAGTAPATGPAAAEGSATPTAPPHPVTPRRPARAGTGRPAPGSLAALRTRLDGLPDGHPSSPYTDDGLVKTPPQRLRQFELGLPAPDRMEAVEAPPRPRPSPSPASNDQDGQAPDDAAPPPARRTPETAHRPVPPRDPDERAEQATAGQDVTSEHSDLVARMLAAGQAAEGRNMFGSYGNSGLTPAVVRIADQLVRGGLAPGSDATTLKPAEQLSAKLARLVARHPDRTADELTRSICDVVRYAFAFEPEDYAEGTWLVHRKFKAQGFHLEARRNRWENPEHKGIWTRWRDPAHDLAFEVQFHTFASWDAVQRTHPAYLLITDPATPPVERARLRARQVAEVAAVKSPPRWAELGDVVWQAR